MLEPQKSHYSGDGIQWNSVDTRTQHTLVTAENPKPFDVGTQHFLMTTEQVKVEDIDIRSVHRYSAVDDDDE